jgi:Uncharacterized protein conserved in bacteria (DUF2125)
MNRRTMLSAAVAAVALLLAGYSAYWWMMAGRLDAGLDSWIVAEQQTGLTIDADRPRIGGYPLSFRTTFRHPHVTGMLGGQPIDWQGADVAAWLWPFNLRSLHLTTTGDHQLAIGASRAMVHVDALDARLHFDASGQVSIVGIESDKGTIALPDGRSTAFQSATAAFDTPPAPPQSDRDPLMEFSMSATGLKLPPDVQLLTANPVDSVAVQGIVKGQMPRAPLKQALAGWRDQGGAIEITAFSAAQAPLSVSGSATIALDADLQPIIAANLAAKGLGPAVDLLAQQKRIGANDVLKLKLFIAATEQKALDGGTQVTSGVTIQNGALYLGPFKIASVAKIEWP